MAQKKRPSPVDKASPPQVTTPVTAAVAATMPIIYSAQIAHTQQITGPVPSPEVLRQYDALNPGLVERIVRMAEQEAEHRRKMETDVIALQGRDQQAYRRSEMAGQVFGLSIGMTAILVAGYTAIHGAQVAGSLLGTAGVGGLVTTFVLGRTLLLKQKQQEFDQIEKAKALREAELKLEK